MGGDAMTNPTERAPKRPGDGLDGASLMARSPLKVHLGCGEVYLSGWVNVDAVGELASEHPDLVAEKATDLANYYTRPYERRLFGHDKRGRNVVDVHATATDLSMFPDSSVDTLLTVNLIDHLRFQDLPAAVAEWRRALKPGGELIIDVGDVRGNAEMVVAAQGADDLEWALRLMYCHSRDQFDSHHWGYTPIYLEELMAKWGFTQLWTRRDFIDHVYPAFQSCFTPAPATRGFGEEARP
jgi:SAM-dependent methyltransferase